MKRTTTARPDDARAALRTFERERYGERPPAPNEIDEAVKVFDRLRGDQHS
jgi:hypothetical protein